MAGKQILGILLMVIAFAAGLAFGGEIIRDIAAHKNADNQTSNSINHNKAELAEKFEGENQRAVDEQLANQDPRISKRIVLVGSQNEPDISFYKDVLTGKEYMSNRYWIIEITEDKDETQP